MKKLYFVLTIVLIYANSASSNDVDEIIGHTSGCHKSHYTPAKGSNYILPYPVGKEYVVSQGNCGQFSHAKGGEVDFQYSYDFAIPIGDDITSARSGVVINKEEEFPNHSNNSFETNWIAIKHSDGTIAVYIHMTTNGVHVEVGDEVKQGNVIGIAGNSGYTGGYPHLHFHVTEREHETCKLSLYDQTERSVQNLKDCKTIPTTFKNADPLDTPLRHSKSYKSIEY